MMRSPGSTLSASARTVEEEGGLLDDTARRRLDRLRERPAPQGSDVRRGAGVHLTVAKAC